MMHSRRSVKIKSANPVEVTSFNRALRRKFGTTKLEDVAPTISSKLLDWCQVQQAPNLLEKILEKLDVPFHYTQCEHSADKRHSGAFLRFVDGTLTLEIDRSSFRSNRGRARFSIAHEIGHIALIHVFGKDVINWSEESPLAYEEVEMLCDQIASHILMPRALLRDHFKRRKLSTLGIHSALKIFGVSKQALLTGIADTQSKLAVFNIRKFARHPNEHSVWRVANSGSSSDCGTSAPWLAIGSTVRKHLQMAQALDSLKADQPWIGEAVWKMGRYQQNFGVIVCKMAPVDVNIIDQAVFEGMEGASRIKQDVFDGLIAVVGPKERMDTNLFV